MSVDRPTEYLIGLVHELRKLPVETEWVEFKHNNSDPVQIGEYLSALSNSAVLHDQPRAWLAWGIRDSDHAVVGTTFRPRQAKTLSLHKAVARSMNGHDLTGCRALWRAG